MQDTDNARHFQNGMKPEQQKETPWDVLVSRNDGTIRHITRTYLEKQTQRHQQHVNIPSTQNQDVFNITVFITKKNRVVPNDYLYELVCNLWVGSPRGSECG